MNSSKRRWIPATLVGAALTVILAACSLLPAPNPNQGIRTEIVQLTDGRLVTCVVLPYNKGISCDWDHAK